MRQRGRVPGRHEPARLALTDDRGQPAMSAGDDRAAGGPRLDRSPWQRVGRRRGDRDHVGGAIDVLDVVAEADERHAVADAERGGEIPYPLQPSGHARPGVTGDQPDRTELAQRRLTERADEHVLTLPVRDAAQDRAHDRGEPARAQCRPPDRADRTDEHLDPSGREVVRERPGIGQHHDRFVA